MKKSLHVIHIEDSFIDSALVQQLLQEDGLVCEIQRIETREQLVEALKQTTCDLILSDCTLPQFHGLEALEIAHSIRPEIPFIFISGTIGEETAIKSLQNGATDYVLKQRLSRLVPAVRRALTEADGRRLRDSMQTQLRQARKLETIGTLAGGLAHDFRNVLQVLKMSIALLPLKAHDPDQIIHLAAQLDKAAERGYDMMQELLVFARQTEAHLIAVNMGKQIESTAQMLQNALPDNVSLVLNLEEDLPSIFADRGQVDRMLTNLILNARDALPLGGDIAIYTDLIRFDRMPANSWQMKDAPYLRVRVSDNGTGMDEATQSRIFEPFFTTKPAGKGTGLGLSVVFGLIEAHQGFIDLQSQVDEGTIFSLFFPLAAGANVDPEKIEVISPTRLLGKTAESEASNS
jgi:two-component system cell cycle sensor histidine kinase/response regulator CckA